MTTILRAALVLFLLAGIADPQTPRRAPGPRTGAGGSGSSSTGGGGGGPSALKAHAAAHVDSGAVTTSAINTTGANFISIEAASIFSNGAISDSKGNTWHNEGLTTNAHNTSLTTYTCDDPCSVGTGHTFTQASNGSGFDQAISVQAFSNAQQVSGTWDDLNILSGQRLGVAASSDPPPSTIATAGIENTTAGVIAIAVVATEQGTGGASTIDSDFTVIDNAGGGAVGITSAWKLIPAASTTFAPIWTAPGDAAHLATQLYAFLGN